MRRLLHGGLGIAALCLVMSGLAHAADNKADLRQAQLLLNSGKAAEAYELLQPYEFYQAGDPAYDYLLGDSALDSGKYNAATLAFERVLAVNPNHAGARMDMARAYFALDDLERATEQFKIVLSLNPPANVKNVVDTYMARIEQQKKARLSALTTYVEGVLGYDTNITNVTRDFTNAVSQSYGLTGLQPTGNSIPRADAYAGVNAGVFYNLPQDTETSWFFGLDGKQKEYFTEHNFRSTTLSGQAGKAFKRELDTYRVALNVQRTMQQGDAATTQRTSLDSNLYGIAGSWQHSLDDRTLASLFGQFNLIRYPDLPLNDNNAATVGVALTRSIAMPYQPVVLASVFYTRERALNALPNGANFSRDVTGLRLAGQMTLDPKLDAYVSVGMQLRDDTKIGARKTNVYGEDQLSDITLGMKWSLDNDWSVRPQIAYIRNGSNISLYNSNRTDYSITLRKDFR